MNKNFWLLVRVVTVLILATVLLGGCGKKEVSPQGGVVSEVTMTTAVDSEDRPINPTTVFPTDADGFIVSFKISGFPVGTDVRAEWIYVGGNPEIEAKIGQNYVMETQSATTTREGEGYTAAVYIRPPLEDYRWPKGNYKVVIYVDEQEKGSTFYKVE
jgi:hypothetical protein